MREPKEEANELLSVGVVVCEPTTLAYSAFLNHSLVPLLWISLRQMNISYAMVLSMCCYGYLQPSIYVLLVLEELRLDWLLLPCQSMMCYRAQSLSYFKLAASSNFSPVLV